MLISEEILRHLVTVLEDRGPADELAPAAAARTTDDDGFGPDLDDPAIVSAPAATATAVVEPPTPEIAEDVAEAETADAETGSVDIAPDSADDEAGAAPADEEEPA